MSFVALGEGLLLNLKAVVSLRFGHEVRHSGEPPQMCAVVQTMSTDSYSTGGPHPHTFRLWGAQAERLRVLLEHAAVNPKEG